jgi:hypothetical protein
LPDGIFSYQKSQFGKIWRALERKRLVYYIDSGIIVRQIWYILWPCGNLVAIW